MTAAASKAGHIGGPLSATDVLVALYFGQLNVDPQNPRDAERNRFILSKGHCAIRLYSVLLHRDDLDRELTNSLRHRSEFVCRD
ncbi:hypothetical protein [Microbacterium sp. BWT-B31]|uniref:hypothetical protein n=1 Tax=Microbacterium sp. BWT-B31 TaxID=3232072 RepID=UPI0035299718